MAGNGLVEESYICKLLEGGSLDTLKESGLRDEMFLTCKDQIQFIQKHEAEYKQLPDKMIFLQKFKDLVKKLGSDMIIIDQLSLMTDQRRADTPRIAFNNISEDAFMLSKKLGKPVIMLAQANREAVKNKKKGQSPELHDLAESDGVAQNATRVISLSVIDGILKLSVKKNRYGINNKDVMVMWDINAGYIKPLLENKEGEKGEAEDYGF